MLPLCQFWFSELVFSSNYIWHIDFSWNKVVRVDSTGPTNGTRSGKVWDPLLKLNSAFPFSLVTVGEGTTQTD